ncbi:TetR/AcrR family transcriptional regulator [Methylomonas sp. AM2-LC]|uniref:TetR/AcrR family transcriptional regulator n=1 Tax=Methylomonas sp. AM2-LC TaxID=3153301 RepID=UPI0032646072
MAKNLHQRLLDAASELFYSQGIQATGIEAIVKHAGTNKMTLYKYFPSKQDLVIAFLRKRDTDFTQWFVENINHKADLPKDKLLAIFEVIEEWMAIPAFRGCAFINATTEFPLEANPVHQLSTEFYDKFKNYISGLAAECGIAQADNLAMQITLLVEGCIVSEQMKHHSGSTHHARQAATILIDTYLQQGG